MFDNMTIWKRIALAALAVMALAAIAEHFMSADAGLKVMIIGCGLAFVGTGGAMVEASRKWLHQRRSEQWRLSGCCPQCGYNLTGNTDGICPECGTHVEDRPPKAATREKDDLDYYDGKSLIIFCLGTVGGVLLMIFMPGSLLGLLMTWVFGGFAVFNALIVLFQAINRSK